MSNHLQDMASFLNGGSSEFSSLKNIGMYWGR